MAASVSPLRASAPLSCDAGGRSEPSPFAAPPTPISRADAQGLASRVLTLNRRMRRADRLTKGGWPFVVRCALVAPARAAREAVDAVRRYGAATERDAGVSRLRQVASTWYLNLRHHFAHTTVYRYRLFTAAKRSPLPVFLDGDHAVVLYRAAALASDLDAIKTLADKGSFEAWCMAQGLPTVPILMEFEGGKVTRDTTPGGALPAVDLFAKWGARFGGSETLRWTYAEGRYLDIDGKASTGDEVVATLAERSRQGLVVLQPRLVNHPALKRISPNALSTLRVMTTKRPGKPARFLASLVRMGTGRSTADNFAQGGIASPIDATTGIAGRARSIDKEHCTHEYDAHPDTGLRITGFEVPRWADAVRLAVDAHDRLGEVPVIGWDVAVLEDRVILLEGNWNPCVKLLQVATQTPLFTTEFGACFGEWIDGPMRSLGAREIAAHRNWYPV